MKLWAVMSKAPNGGVVVVADRDTPMPLFCLSEALAPALVEVAQMVAQMAVKNSTDPALAYGFDLVLFEAKSVTPIELETKKPKTT